MISKMKNNVIRIFIVARSKQDWQRLCNLVGLANDVEVVQRPDDTGETIEVVQKSMPDVLILDIDLPQGRGIALLKQVHLQNPTLAVIVLSYYSSAQYRRVCEHAGAAYFFDKSTEFQQIPVIMENLAQQKYSKYYVSNYLQ
jgi:DNA-binding NarL/FixJ family response regulator